MVTAAMKLKDTPWKKSYDKPGQHIKTDITLLTIKTDITLLTKVRLVNKLWFFQWSCMDVRVGP